MPDLIILGLHPTEPMSGSDFTTLLNGLTITAYDLSFSNSVEGDQIGVAQGLADVPALGDDSVDVTATSTLQLHKNPRGSSGKGVEDTVAAGL